MSHQRLGAGVPEYAPVMAQQQQDWHRADIVAARHKKRISLAALSRQAGLSDSTLANTFYRP
ncbi:DNA-binding protein Ner [Pectobacterium carotovorum subsp. carotovorum PCCS1]|nr:DNA-binding protein Ner [Pectobacterium carotovorum subsp. carotovorum PCCS1]